MTIICSTRMSECLQMYNLLLVRLNVAMSLSSSNEINSELLIALYRSVSADTEPSVAGDPHKSLSYIITSLETLLGTDLDHILPAKMLEKDEETLYNLAEIYLGLLDLIEDTKENDEDTQDLMKVEDTLDQLRLESSCPFSPIPDSTQDQIFRTKFPAVVNSSYSGSEADDHVIRWVSEPVGNNRDSSRSEGTKSVSDGGSKSSKSLFAKIEKKINETGPNQTKSHEIKPIRVTSRLTSADLNWTDGNDTSGRTSELIRSVPNSSNSTVPFVKNKKMETLDLSAIERSASEETFTAEVTVTDNKTITPINSPRNEEILDDPKSAKNDSTATEDIVARIDQIEKEILENSKKIAAAKNADNSTRNSNQSNNSSSVKRESSNDSIATGDLIGGVSADISDESMKFLIQALQKTVEDSKKVRQEYEIEKANRSKVESKNGPPKLSTGPKKSNLKSSKKSSPSANISSKKKELAFNPEAEMKKLLDKENQLKNEKQKLICDEFENELSRIKNKNKAEQPKIKDPKVKPKKSVQTTGKMTSASEPVCPIPSAGNVQFTVDIPKTSGSPKKSPSKSQRKPMGNLYKDPLVIDEGDILKTIMDEIPGLDYDRETMKLLLDKQEKQILLLDKEARQYASKVRQKDQNIADTRERQRMMAKIVDKEEAAARRAEDIKTKKQEERRLQRELQSKRQKNAKIKKYFNEYQTGLRKSLTKKKYQEEQMLKRIFEEGLATQKNRLRELRSYAQEMRAEENKKREAELQSIENFYRDKFEILAEDMKIQKEKNKAAEREHLRKISSAKSGLTKRLEEEIKEMQSCIIKGNDFDISGVVFYENESMFYRDLEEQRLKKEIQMAKFKSQINNAKHSA